MKRIALIIALLLVAFLAIQAQTIKKLAAPAPSQPATAASAAAAAISRIAVPAGAIRLENDSSQVVFYLVLGMKSAELNQLLAQPKQVLERLKAGRDSLAYLPARTVRPAIAVSETEQLVLGFSTESGASAWRVWYLRIPAKGLRPAPPIFMVSLARELADASGLPLSLNTFDFELPALSVRIDGRFVDWLKYDDLPSWSERNPPSVQRQQGSDTATIKLADSQSWAKAGTDLEHFRLVRNQSELLLMVSSRSLMSRGLSVLLRLYDASGQNTNRYTLEIPVDGTSGPALAWDQSKPDPKVVGDFATADYYLEARFRLADLPAEVQKLLGQESFCELSCGFSQPGQYEEFYYGRFPVSSIIKVE